MSIKTKMKRMLNSKWVITIMMFIILFFISVIFVLIQDVQHKMDNSAISVTQNSLESLSDNIGASIKYDQRTIETYANMIQKNPTFIKDYLKELTSQYQFLEANWISDQGVSFNQDGEVIHLDDLPVSVISKSDSVSFSDATEGSFGVWEYVYQYRVQNQGVLYVRISLKRYDNGKNMTFYDGKGLAYLFDSETKKIILTPKVPNVMWAYMQNTDAVFAEIGYSEEELKQQIYPALKNKDSIVLQGTIEDEKYYISLRVLEEHDAWYLCSVIPASYIQQESSLILQTLLIILLICIVMVCTIFLYVIYEILQRNRKQKEYLQIVEMQNAIYDAMSEASDTFVCIFDREIGRMEFIFKNSIHIVGLSNIELENNMTLFQSIFDSADQTLYKRLMNGQMKSVENYYCQMMRSDTHEMRDLKLTLKRIKVAGHEKYIIFMEDVTQDMRLRESLETAVADAQQANSAKSEFLSRMSHEMRTPMNAIIGMSEIAMRSLDNRFKIEDCLNKIKLSSMHLLNLINDILDISKIENGKITLNNEKFLLSDFITEIYGIIHVQAFAKHQEFTIELIDVTSDAIVGDDIRLKQILINLLNNSVKYTAEYGQIHLRIKEEKHTLNDYAKFHFIVEDNGVGMSEKFIQKIGMPFEQEHNQFHHQEGGTGLGLAIVKNIVSIMGGMMQVKSQLGKGTQISVTLSLRKNDDIVYQNIKQFEGYRVLVINEDIQTLTDTQNRFQDFGVICDIESHAHNGYQRILDSQNNHQYYQLVIVDENLSQMDCIELLDMMSQVVDVKTMLCISSYDCSHFSSSQYHLIRKPLLKNRLYQILSILDNDGEKQVYHEDEKLVLKGKHVLVVEDNELNCEIAKELLEMAGMIVDCAENGQVAVQKCEEQSVVYDLVLMDIQMPVMDGYEATRRIHQHDAHMKIIAMSANAYADDIQKCYDAGMIAHLSKPIDIQHLYKILSENIGERECNK